MMMLRTAIVTLCLLFAASAARADVVAQWTFETSVPTTAGPFAAEVNNSTGVAEALGFHASAATVYSNPVGNGSAESFSSNNWAIGDYYQFAAPTVNFSKITISFDHISSTTGPKDFKIAYSTDGTNFTDVGNYQTIANSAPNAWNSTTPVVLSQYSVDLSGIAALDGAAMAYFRLINTSTVSASGGVVAAGGTSRVDNLTINGVSSTAVPEPSSILLGVALFGGFGGTRLLRRRGQRAEPTSVTV
jgi:hypothetical protein